MDEIKARQVLTMNSHSFHVLLNTKFCVSFPFPPPPIPLPSRPFHHARKGIGTKLANNATMLRSNGSRTSSMCDSRYFSLYARASCRPPVPVPPRNRRGGCHFLLCYSSRPYLPVFTLPPTPLRHRHALLLFLWVRGRAFLYGELVKSSPSQELCIALL